jgi:hypothetical protein
MLSLRSYQKFLIRFGDFPERSGFFCKLPSIISLLPWMKRQKSSETIRISKSCRGTDLIIALRERHIKAEGLLDISRIGLSRIYIDDGRCTWAAWPLFIK